MNTQGDGMPATTAIPKAKQREALFFVLNQTITETEWILTSETRSKLALSENDFSDYMLTVMNTLVSNGTLGRLSKSARLAGKEGYTPQEFMDDLEHFVWQKTDNLSSVEKNMQYAYVTNLISVLDLKADDKKRSKLSSAKIEAKGILFEKLLKAREVCTHNASGTEAGHYANLAFLINEALNP